MSRSVGLKNKREKIACSNCTEVARVVRPMDSQCSHQIRCKRGRSAFRKFLITKSIRSADCGEGKAYDDHSLTSRVSSPIEAIARPAGSMYQFSLRWVVRHWMCLSGCKDKAVDSFLSYPSPCRVSSVWFTRWQKRDQRTSRSKVS